MEAAVSLICCVPPVIVTDANPTNEAAGEIPASLPAVPVSVVAPVFVTLGVLPRTAKPTALPRYSVGVRAEAEVGA